MILAEKIYQKFNNLKSKDGIKDFFVFYDDYRSLHINQKSKEFHRENELNKYREHSKGYFVILWDDHLFSHGNINAASMDDFDLFIEKSKELAMPYEAEIFIPERGIYPMVIAYSKSLADMVDIPEYLLKTMKVATELDVMAGADCGATQIQAVEGARYAFSSRNVDESYLYTQFSLKKSVGHEVDWNIQTAGIIPMEHLHEVMSFLGDTYQSMLSEQVHADTATSALLSPAIFKKVFHDQIVLPLQGSEILQGNGIFTIEDFKNRTRALGNLSFSYDPLISHKPGSYRFTSYGLKAQRQHFVKFGKLETPILDNMNYSRLGYSKPTVELASFANLKIDGLKRRIFREIRSSSQNVLFGVSHFSYRKADKGLVRIGFDRPIIMHNGKMNVGEPCELEINLIELLQNNRIELVEFPDGQIGALIK
ncbi:MAG: metallopeptidase TldD-related protein [Candidatus Dojkabacteria bacterium]